MNFQDKVAFVTEGGQGIGKAIAHHFLCAQAQVVIADIDAEAGRETASEYTHLGDIQFIETDISNESSVQSAIAQTLDTFGRLDILVNNAAISDPENPPIEQFSLEQWQQTIAVNLTGAFLCTKYAVPHLRYQQGVIINIASTRALMSEPNTEAYSTTKGGILAFTHALANSLGPGIRVNCISPGWIAIGHWKKSSIAQDPQLREQDHQQHLVGRVGKPEDVASMVLYLSSPAAAFITGANFVLDGGMTRKMIYL